jgi:hypothetical protein
MLYGDTSYMTMLAKFLGYIETKTGDFRVQRVVPRSISMFGVADDREAL